MSELIEVYFTSENDAESAKAKLVKLKAGNIFIEEVDGDTKLNVFVPFAAADTSTAGTAIPLNSMSSMAPIIPVEETTNHSKKAANISHFLTANVASEDYAEALMLLNSLDCFYKKK